MAVATIAAQPGTSEVRNGVMEWCLKPVYNSWQNQERFNYRNEDCFPEYYFAIEALDPPGALQIGGNEQRWELYHEILLLSKVSNRFAVESEGSFLFQSCWNDTLTMSDTKFIQQPTFLWFSLCNGAVV